MLQPPDMMQDCFLADAFISAIMLADGCRLRAILSDAHARELPYISALKMRQILATVIYTHHLLYPSLR